MAGLILAPALADHQGGIHPLEVNGELPQLDTDTLELTMTVTDSL